MSEEQKKIFEEVKGAELFSFENKDDSITGEVVRVADGMFGKQPIIKTDDGKEIGLPSYTVLKSKFENIEVGKVVRVTYLGEVKSQSGKNYKDFKVEVAK